VIAIVVTTFVGVVAVIAIMDVTILKLPHMQVVLSEQEETDKMDKEEMDKEKKEEEEMMRLRKRRRLDSSGQEISSGSEERVGETMRREPAHRRRNRQKVKKQQMQQNGLSSSADEVTALQNEGGMERSKIEELLRKYGFGSWTKPEEVWRGRNISRGSEIPESTNTS